MESFDAEPSCSVGQDAVMSDLRRQVDILRQQATFLHTRQAQFEQDSIERFTEVQMTQDIIVLGQRQFQEFQDQTNLLIQQLLTRIPPVPTLPTAPSILQYSSHHARRSRMPLSTLAATLRPPAAPRPSVLKPSAQASPLSSFSPRAPRMFVYSELASCAATPGDAHIEPPFITTSPVPGTSTYISTGVAARQTLHQSGVATTSMGSHFESDSQSWPSDFLGPATRFPTTASFSIPSSLSPLRSAEISFLGHRPEASSPSVSQVQTTAAPADSSPSPVALVVSSPHHSTTPSEGETVETQESETASPAYISRQDGGNQGSSYATTLATDRDI